MFLLLTLYNFPLFYRLTDRVERAPFTQGLDWGACFGEELTKVLAESSWAYVMIS